MSANVITLVGQPFTITGWSIPVNCTLACNCACAHGGVPTIITIINGAPTPCPGCHRIYVAAFNPQTNQLQVGMGQPEQEKVPS